ncbi:enolase-phosphatase E1-like [Anneissia japonica]|uniref:enolase-phosphatase E1-like n=1 Tax=Anneissia japonica TaxID=1529436 RepID=UPI0014259E64|nr:enolase-phosphatase E1-like [Anneissia japonica]
MYNTVSVLIFVGFLTITGYGKPLPKSSEEDTVGDVKLNTCATDVIRLIAQQEKNNELDLSTMSEECQKLVNNALNDEKIEKNENKRDDNDGSADGNVSEEEYSSLVASLPGTRDAWRVTVDGVLYHLLKALEFEHEKLQKTLKWVAEIQDNQNKQFKGNFSKQALATSEGSGEYTLSGDILNDKRKRTEESDRSRADRMKELYNDITTGEFQKLMKNKPPPFTPNWNGNQVEEQEIVDGEESASKTPEENEEQEHDVEESASEIPEDGEVEKEYFESGTPYKQIEKKKATDIDDNQTPKEKRLISAEVYDRDEAEDESEVDGEDSASETPEAIEESGDYRKDSASKTPADEVVEVDEENSASKAPADERAEDEVDRGDSASKTPADERAEDAVDGEDSASETQTDERVEDAVDGGESASETAADDVAEDGVHRGDSASETPEDADNGKNEVTIEDSASEIPEDVDIEHSASEIPEEENEGIIRNDEHEEKEYNSIGNNYITKTAKQQFVKHFKNADDNKIQENKREKWDAIEVKREPEVLIKSSNDITNTESYLLNDDPEFDEELAQLRESSASETPEDLNEGALKLNENDKEMEFGSKKDIKDTIVNELKDLQNGDDSDKSHRIRAVEKAMKKLSRDTHPETD